MTQAKVAFDVDGTLITARTNPTPNYKVIKQLLWFFNNNDDVYVWSGGGVEYAQHMVDKLGLNDFVKVISKDAIHQMDICFDDEEVRLAACNIQVR